MKLANVFSVPFAPFVFAVVCACASTQAVGQVNIPMPAFAKVESFKSLPPDAQANVNKEYAAGHNSYQTRATLQSDLRKEKGIALKEGDDMLWVFAFREKVLLEGEKTPAQTQCDIIQYRKSDGGVRIHPQADDEGPCVSYYTYKPIVMDLNGDGYQDLIYFPVFKQPQVGGEYDAVKAFLYSPKDRFLCFSQDASGLVQGGPNNDPKKLHEYIAGYLKEKKITLECGKS